MTYLGSQLGSSGQEPSACCVAAVQRGPNHSPTLPLPKDLLEGGPTDRDKKGLSRVQMAVMSGE